MICTCENVAIGSYDNQIMLDRPIHMPKEDRPIICVDRCIAGEIQGLWARGISTTGCCCGHGILDPFIGVEFADIPRMKALGYVVAPNTLRPNDEDSFYPLGWTR